MEKERSKEKGPYREKLLGDERRRYMEKISQIEGTDPYELRNKDWCVDPALLPPLSYLDVVNYLVYGISFYTVQQFKAYKSLEAHMQFSNGWVHDLQIHRPADCDNTVVLAKVMHSQRVREKPASAWAIISSEGLVMSAHCTCMAGIAESCTHVGALLFKIEATVRCRERTTVTGVAAYWMIPSNVDKVQPEVGYKIDYTSASAKKKAIDMLIDGQLDQQPSIKTCSSKTLTPAPSEQEMADFYADLNQTGDKAAILKVLPRYCEDYKDPVEPVLLPKSLRCLRNKACGSWDAATLQQECEKISDNVNISAEQAEKVERETRKQTSSPAWFAVRAGRVTASNLHSVLQTKLDRPSATIVTKVCYPEKGRQLKVPATQWGVANEDTARRCYSNYMKRSHHGLHVERCGFIINPDYPYVGCSPDGLVRCSCCGQGCLEIKCPYKHRDSSILQACDDPEFCLQHVNGVLCLKPNHPYYAQVQCQIFVSKTEYCDFVIWTQHDLCVLRIAADEEFWASAVLKAEAFFRKICLPELVAQRYTVATPAATPNSGGQCRVPLSVSPQKNRTSTPKGSSKRLLSASPRKKTQQKRTKGQNKRQTWCFCKGGEEVDDMVACESENCTIEWFHIGCVGLDEVPDKEDVWFCPNCVE